MSTKICPHCESEIQAEAKKCRYCKERLDWTKNDIDGKIIEETKNTTIIHKENNRQDKPLLAMIVWWWLLLFIVILLVISYINDGKDNWMVYNLSNDSSICNELQKERILGLPVGEMKHQLSSIFGIRDISETFYIENDLYSAAFTVDGWRYSNEEKKNISAIMKQIWLTSSSGFKPKINIRKVKRKEWDPFIRTLKKDWITNGHEYVSAIQSLSSVNAKEYDNGYGYEISVENGGTLSDNENVKQQTTVNSYNNLFEGKYLDGKKISWKTFEKYKKRWCFDLSRYLDDAYNNAIFD